VSYISFHISSLSIFTNDSYFSRFRGTRQCLILFKQHRQGGCGQLFLSVAVVRLRRMISRSSNAELTPLLESKGSFLITIANDSWDWQPCMTFDVCYTSTFCCIINDWSRCPSTSNHPFYVIPIIVVSPPLMLILCPVVCAVYLPYGRVSEPISCHHLKWKAATWDHTLSRPPYSVTQLPH
jgi:hypothetical protein